MIDLTNHLLIARDVFLVGEVRLYGRLYYTSYLRHSMWEQACRYHLKDGKRWHKKYGYGYYWSYSPRFVSGGADDRALGSGLNWNGVFESRQAAFTVVYSTHGPQRHSCMSREERDEWWAAWKEYAAKMGLLTIPVFVP